MGGEPDPSFFTSKQGNLFAIFFLNNFVCHINFIRLTNFKIIQFDVGKKKLSPIKRKQHRFGGCTLGKKKKKPIRFIFHSLFTFILL